MIEYKCQLCGQKVGVISGESIPMCNGNGRHKMTKMLRISDTLGEDPCKDCISTLHMDYCGGCRYKKPSTTKTKKVK